MRQPEYRPSWPQSIVLIGVLVVVFFAQNLARPNDVLPLFLQPGGRAVNWIYQLFTYQFLHDGSVHLFVNCLSLYFIGPQIEQVLGGRRFWGVFITSGVIGGLLQLAVASFVGSASVVGSSAGICGLMAAFSLLHWNETIQFLVAFVIPVSLQGKYLLLVTVVIASIGLVTQESNVAHAAHLGGLLGGFVLSKILLGDMPYWFRLPNLKLRKPKKQLVTVVSGGQSGWKQAARTSSPEELPAAEFISREVDPILDKISAHGIHSLTDRERKILEAARSKMSQRR